MSTDERDPLHEMLCAYLLGEATDEERAQVESALADSPELRAEYARLESTIGLVQDAFPADETLSDAALATLMAAAGDAHGQAPGGLRLVGGPAWYHTPLLRAAAAVVALLGGVLGALQYPSLDARSGDAVAALDERIVPKGEAVRLLLDEVARVRAESDVLFEARAAKLAVLDAEPGLELHARTAYLGFASAALEEQDFDTAYKWAEQARDAHQGNADLDLALRLIERQDADALVAVKKVQERRNEVFSIQANDDTLRFAGIAVDQTSQLYSLNLDSDFSGAASAGSLDGQAAVKLLRQDVDQPGSLELELGDQVREQEQLLTELQAQVAGGEALRARGLSTDAGGARTADKESMSKANPSAGRDGAIKDEARRAGGELLGRQAGQSAPERTTLGVPQPNQAAEGKTSDLARRKTEAAQRPEPAGSVAGDKFGFQGERGRTRELENAPAESAAIDSLSLGLGGELAKVESANKQREEALTRLPALEFGEQKQDLSGEAIVEQLSLEFAGQSAQDGKGYEQGRYGESNGVRRGLSRPELDRRVDERFEEIKVDSLPRPGEQPHDMFYRWWGDNPFVLTGRDRLATFSVDVDTASYALARRYLNDGYLPEKAQIRTEEFVNYFRPDLAPPTTSTFAISTELAPSPFGGQGAQKQLLRVGVRGKEVQSYERKPLVLTFVVDTSGSMRKGDRLELVKHAMGLLLTQLDSRDMIGVVTYAKESNELLPPTSAANRGLFDSLVGPLQPNGGTNAEAGLQLGYEVATRAYNAQADNRVIFLSDGVANIGETDQDRINASIERHRSQRIFLNTIGVGMENHNDAFLEQLADKGDGICDYIDDARAAERAIVERFSGAFTPIASDVKIQVAFDPAQVLRYRLLGYENRAIADVDFRNDAVDAGEVGAGHQVTALFEIERAGYGTGAPIADVHLRWLPPVAGSGPAEEIAQPVYGTLAAPTFASASAGFQRAALAAQLAEFLRRSEHTAQDPYSQFLAELQRVASLPALAADVDTQELLALAVRAGELREQATLAESELERTVDDYRRYRYLREELRGTEQRLGRDDRQTLEGAERALEGRLRELIREDISQRER